MPHIITIKISDKLWNELKNYPHLNWAEVMLDGIGRKLKELESKKRS
jgi:hypothetical protein